MSDGPVPPFILYLLLSERTKFFDRHVGRGKLVLFLFLFSTAMHPG